MTTSTRPELVHETSMRERLSILQQKQGTYRIATASKMGHHRVNGTKRKVVNTNVDEVAFP